jgi:hypothetical protein
LQPHDTASRAAAPIIAQATLIVSQSFFTARANRPAALDEALDAALEGGARQQHLAVAGRAADADLGAKPYHAPSIAATRVRLAHLNEITEVYVDWRLWHNNGKLRVES